MNRLVKPELLDTLPSADPRAIHSRNDLRRINAWMRSAAIMAESLEKFSPAAPSWHLTEIGAGDGNFLLSVTKQMSLCRPGAKVTLLDCQPVVASETLADFAALGWPAAVVAEDVFNWPLTAEPPGIVVANLFLHHFEDARLADLLRLVAARAELFIALEPRRARWPLFCSRLLWLIGCNAVTRHDATVSVRAGFSGHEISSLWPDNKNWRLTENAAGMFSHLFIARKNP
jgi:hypothetical protein